MKILLHSLHPCFICLLFLVIANCTNQRSAQFIEAEYQFSRLVGTGKICGEAFLHANNGNITYGKGSRIWLDPETSYSTEWFKNEVIEGKTLSTEDGRIHEYRREQTADSNGQFCFRDLPPGQYYLTSRITRQFLNDGIAYKTSEWAYAQIHLSEGQSLQVKLTRPNTTQPPF